MNIAIAIPARYASTRFPGKPLAMIDGRTMLSRVVHIARNAATPFDAVDYINMSVFVTTDDKRIEEHVGTLGVPCIMTSKDCKTGSDRVMAAIKQLDHWPDFVVNLQGDAPFTPAAVMIAMIQAFIDDSSLEVVTPVHRLSWASLDRLRAVKKTTPFSGTTAVINARGEALWFSKNIIPALRDEAELRKKDALSPVYQHMGLYGYTMKALEKFCALPPGRCEQLEGLEQLRMLENGMKIQTVTVEINEGLIHSGIDTPEDLERAEALLKAGTHSS